MYDTIGKISLTVISWLPTYWICKIISFYAHKMPEDFNTPINIVAIETLLLIASFILITYALIFIWKDYKIDE